MQNQMKQTQKCLPDYDLQAETAAMRSFTPENTGRISGNGGRNNNTG